MQKLSFILAMIIASFSLQAQTEQADTEEQNSYPKHELGFSTGAFPIVGGGGFFDNEEKMIMYKDYNQYDSVEYKNMYSIGAYLLTYNYHFNSKHSLGVSVQWVGNHINTYRIYDGSYVNPDADTVNGRGWNHYFTVQANYRKTYYRKNDKLALYWGISIGATLCVKDKNILPKETRHYFLGKTSNAQYPFFGALHINAFGIELGKKYVFHFELGIGSQGFLKTGLRYKF
jgi:hypothetical protein